ncbi:caspase family protein [Streptomyces sp. Tu102]|uniref:caspase family protein n=1 Tax=Streptomyces sp. Tu102 TaxID=2838019 RepID=UPI00202A17F5|nr:caspase family protein [Streptomyces sp. Tu102]
MIATAVSKYTKCPAWDRPGLVEAREQVIDVFTRQLGYRHHTALGLDPSRMQLTDQLRAFCKAGDRREDDLLAVYLSGHGQVLDDGGDHVLMTTDTDPADVAYTALPTVELARAMLRETRVRRLLLVLDTCYSGQGGNELAAVALERIGTQWKQAQTGSGLVIVSSAQPHQQAQAGLFPRLFTEAVGGWATAGHGPDTLAVSTVVQQINDHPERPAWQHVSLSQIGLTGEPPAFLANPRHSTRLTDVDLAVQQAALFDAHARRRETELTNRLLVRAMGYHEDAAQGWWFCGRHTALADLATWLRAPAADGASVCRVVTAGPGSGKTAVLGLIAALTHPERRRTVPLDALGLGPGLMPEEGAVGVAIYAQNLSDNDVLHGLAAAAHIRADTVGDFLKGLDAADRHRPLTVLIDALDEAATPHTLCTDILRPLIDHSRGRIRLLLGTRPYLLDRLGIDPDHPEPAYRRQVINLDDDRYADTQALTTYTIRNLIEAHPASPYRHHIQALRPVAQAVAEAAGSSFLVARITAGTLAAEPTLPDAEDPAWRASLPRHAGQAMHDDLTLRLGPDAQKAADLLRPLAFAEGQGLPWEDIWAPLASAISGRTYSNEDLLWLRHEAGSYVVEATEAGRSAYRLYHQALTEHLRENVDESAVHAAFTDVLITRVPYRADATRDWSRAHPYILNHLAAHATKAGQLDEILTHSEYLVHAVPRSLIPHLAHARSDSARLTADVYDTSLGAAVYRSSPGVHTATTPALRRQLLALNAARAGTAGLYHQLTRHIPPGHWTPIWATGSTLIPALRDNLARHSGGVFSVACTVLDGAPVAVTGGTGGTVRVWDLTSRRQLGEPLTGHTSWVFAVACTLLDGTPVAVTTGSGMVRVWDLASRRPLGEPLTGHTGPVSSVACTTLDGAPVAVTSGADGTVRMWDLTSRRPLGKPLTSHTGGMSRLTCTVLDSTPVALTTGNGTVRVWDLASRRPLGEPLTGHGHWWSAVACTVLDGAPLAVTGGTDGAVRVWDLTSRRPLGEPLTRHANCVSAVACTVLDSTPIAVTTGGGTVRVWDLRTGEAVGLMAVPNPRTAAVSAAGDLVVGIGHDVAVFQRRTACTPR